MKPAALRVFSRSITTRGGLASVKTSNRAGPDVSNTARVYSGASCTRAPLISIGAASILTGLANDSTKAAIGANAWTRRDATEVCLYTSRGTIDPDDPALSLRVN